jgi:hypothetical protein
MPLIDLEPRKNVLPVGVHVNSPTTSFIARPSMSVSALLIDFLEICLLALKHTVKQSPSFCHHVSCANRSFLNFVCRHVRSFVWVMKNCLCCWYVVLLFGFLL